jgi:uncharacterized membrane protein YgdD (TMEM256/DUF423 family)
MKQIFLSIAAILGGLSVAAGAFGTHWLRGQISDRVLDTGYHQRALEIFEVATRYQMYHALALLAVAILLTNKPSPNKSLIVSGWLFIIGTLLFSGSLYALSLTTTTSLGLITPFGGVALICGWCALAIGAVGKSQD